MIASPSALQAAMPGEALAPRVACPLDPATDRPEPMPGGVFVGKADLHIAQDAVRGPADAAIAATAAAYLASVHLAS